jgi:VWFA-related protein
MEEERASKYAVGTIGTLSMVVRGLREVTGRKAVLLIAESFRLFTTQGRNIRLIESLKQVADQANRSSTVIYTLDASGLNPLNLTAEDRVAGLSYTFDPNAFGNPGSPPTPPLKNRGTPRRNDVAPNAASIALEEGGSSAAFKRLDALVAQRDSQNVQNHTVLSFLADRTGGLFTANTNNLSLATERMLQDQSGYYLLAYRPSESDVAKTGRASFHKLAIRVKRSGLNVRSREGYYTGTNEISSAKTREQRLSQALISPFAAGAVAMRITPLFFNDRTEGSYLRVLLHLQAKDLTFNEQPNKSQQTVLDIVAVNLGEDGKVVDQFSDTQTLDVSGEAFPGVQKNGVSFVLNVPVKKSGAYQLRVAVRDVASDRIGSAGKFVEVPDVAKNHFSLSGIVISGINQGANQSPNGDALLQAVPSLRRLTHGMVLSYSYTIYNAEVNGTGRPQLETQMLLFREGKQVFAGKVSPFDPSTQSDMKRLKVTGGLRLGPELPAGAYVLQVMVTDKLRNKPNIAVQTLDFVIVE